MSNLLLRFSWICTATILFFGIFIFPFVSDAMEKVIIVFQFLILILQFIAIFYGLKGGQDE